MPSLASLLLPHREISRDAEEKATLTPVPYRVRLWRDFSHLPQMGSLLAGYPLTLTGKNKTRSSIFNESWQCFCFLQLPSPKMKRRTPSESLGKGWKSYHDLKCICVRNNKNFNYQHILPLLFLHVVASF